MTKLGILGLGKMGSAFALNLLSKGHEVHVYNRSKERLRELVAKGAIAIPPPTSWASLSMLSLLLSQIRTWSKAS